MKNLTLKNIANSCDGQLFCNDIALSETEVSDIVTDNRKVTQGSLFIAIKGARAD